jgi:1-deoxy-D-xylulose-5-phosphate synthase
MKYTILDRINRPEDLKDLSYKDLDALAFEVRDYMLDVVSKNGGHLASSLGAVETTIALYKVFDPGVDRIIWDVGHQTYTHKILTGRRSAFKTLRQYKGISGFLKPDESKYDAFGAGHTSTSISAAMGFAKARDLKGQKYKVIAVIGDASLANGMAFEAINNLGHQNTDMLIVVIDNEMSISPTVGALSSYLNKIITGKGYNEFQINFKQFVEKLPQPIGTPVASVLKHAGESIKGMFTPGLWFEELGFRYFGPINAGHNIKTLVETFSKLKTIEGPKIVHIITKKGKGYAPAENNPTLFHGVGPFDRETGQSYKSSGGKSYSKVFSESLVRIARTNNKVVAIVAAMIDGTNLLKFKLEYPDRFFDVGIAEEHAVTFAAGLAKSGFKPFVAIYSTFMQRAVDQIIHDVGINKLPVVFILDRAGLVGEDGPTHHGVFDIVYMKMIPGMVVMAPSDSVELQRMMLTAAGYKDGPVAIRFPRGNARESGVLNNFVPVSIGRARVAKKGKHITVICLGPVVGDALKAAGEIERSTKFTVEVIDARFAKPIDRSCIMQSVMKTKNVITVEEGVIEGGFGQSVMRLIQRTGVDGIKTMILGIPDKFIEHGSMSQLRRDCGIDEKGIEKAIKNLLSIAD